MKSVKRIVKIVFYGTATIIAVYILWLINRVFVFDYFTIPSSSMTPTIQPGNKVIVNKLLFGPRIYTEFHFNKNGQELKSFRLKGVRDIARNDIVVFNFPVHNNKISFRINHVYCKRVIGLPGDTVSAKCGYIYNNNFDGVLGIKEKQVRLHNKTEESLRKEKVYDIAPHDEHLVWTIKNWGPLYVPRKGDIIKVSAREAVLYQKILEWEVGDEITYDWNRNMVYAGKRKLVTHTFKHNYYHICGDHSADSNDSRYWGFVPEEYLIGIVSNIIKL